MADSHSINERNRKKTYKRMKSKGTCQCLFSQQECEHTEATCKQGFGEDDPTDQRVLCGHCLAYKRKRYAADYRLRIKVRNEMNEAQAQQVRQDLQMAQGLRVAAEQQLQGLLDHNQHHNQLLAAEHLAAGNHATAQTKRVIADKSAVPAVNQQVKIRHGLVRGLHAKIARQTTSTAAEDGWDVIAGNRKTLAVPNPPELPAPSVEDERAFACFHSLEPQQKTLVHQWCRGAAEWSKEKLPFMKDHYVHAFVLLYQHGDSRAQPPHIDIGSGKYQGSVTITEGPWTEIFQPETSPTAESVAKLMGMTLEDVMRHHPDIVEQRDLLICPREKDFHGALQGAAKPGDACLFEGGIVHRGPAYDSGRNGLGRLILFWVVSPLSSKEHYDSSTQRWIGDLQMLMAVETKDNDQRKKLVVEAAGACYDWWHSYPKGFNPYKRLTALYDTDSPEKKMKAKEVVKAVTKEIKEIRDLAKKKKARTGSDQNV